MKCLLPKIFDFPRWLFSLRWKRMENGPVYYTSNYNLRLTHTEYGMEPGTGTGCAKVLQEC